MKHEIDLKKYNMRTDLLSDIVTEEIDGIVKKIVKEDDITITEITVLESGSIRINKKEGTYITIEFNDVTDYDNKEKVKKV